MRTGVGTRYNFAMVASVYSVALNPVGKRGNFSEKDRPKDNRKSKEEKDYSELIGKEEEKDRFLLEEDYRTIDLIA